MVKEFVANNDVRQITRLTTVLAEEFAVSHNNHSRKGGLIGLAATAIALGKVRIHVDSIIKIITCCSCEYNPEVSN